MKDIGFSQWYNADSYIDSYDKVINIAYTFNYKLLCQINKMNQSEGRSKGLFGPRYDDAIKKAELKTIVDARNNYFNFIIPKIDESYQSLLNEFKNARAFFYLLFAQLYGERKNFNKTFNTLSCQDEEFNVDMNDYLNGELSENKKETFSAIFDSYELYNNLFVSMLKCISLKELINKLNLDFSSNGYKTSYLILPQHNIATISEEEINELFQITNNAIKISNKKIKDNAKLLKIEQRDSKKYISYLQQYHPGTLKAKKTLVDTREYRKALINIKNMINIFKGRFKFANQFYNPDENARRVVDRFENLISFGRLSPKLNKGIYYHKGEMTLLYQSSLILPELQEKVKVLIDRVGGQEYLEDFGTPEQDIKVLLGETTEVTPTFEESQQSEK